MIEVECDEQVLQLVRGIFASLFALVLICLVSSIVFASPALNSFCEHLNYDMNQTQDFLECAEIHTAVFNPVRSVVNQTIYVVQNSTQFFYFNTTFERVVNVTPERSQSDIERELRLQIQLQELNFSHALEVKSLENQINSIAQIPSVDSQALKTSVEQILQDMDFESKIQRLIAESNQPKASEPVAAHSQDPVKRTAFGNYDFSTSWYSILAVIVLLVVAVCLLSPNTILGLFSSMRASMSAPPGVSNGQTFGFGTSSGQNLGTSESAPKRPISPF